MTHICVSKLTIIGSHNGLSPDRRQAIIWTNAGISLIGPLGTNFSGIFIKTHTIPENAFENVVWKTTVRQHLYIELGSRWQFYLRNLNDTWCLLYAGSRQSFMGNSFPVYAYIKMLACKLPVSYLWVCLSGQMFAFKYILFVINSQCQFNSAHFIVHLRNVLSGQIKACGSLWLSDAIFYHDRHWFIFIAKLLAIDVIVLGLLNYALIEYSSFFVYKLLTLLFSSGTGLIESFNSSNNKRGINKDCQGSTLTHWGRVTHICITKLTIIGSNNGSSPGWRRAIIWTNDGILLIGPLGTNFSENQIEILTFSFTKMRLKVSSAKWRPFVSVSMC